jgi:DNA (cytosine-5)-methyltransferase 1
MDLIDFIPDKQVYDVDLLSAGLPRVKAAAATNRRRGSTEELKLLEATIMLVHGVQPRAVLIENMPELATKDNYAQPRVNIKEELDHLGYVSRWFVVDAADYGVSQHRKQGVLIAFKGAGMDAFEKPLVQPPPPSVGTVLLESMASRGWSQASVWAAKANRLAPTLVGGSWDRGGPDLGPTGSKRTWATMGVDGKSIADLPPDPGFHWDPDLGRAGMVRLTVAQTALLQGFPPDWRFAGKKTKQYRQVGNASPPPVGRALGLAIRKVLERH